MRGLKMMESGTRTRGYSEDVASMHRRRQNLSPSTERRMPRVVSTAMSKSPSLSRSSVSHLGRLSPSRDGKDRVTVAVKITSDDENSNFVEQSHGELRILDRRFRFDRYFSSISTDRDSFELIGVPILMKAYHGYNSTIFFCGGDDTQRAQSIFGDFAKNNGMVPQICNALFDPESLGYLVDPKDLPACDRIELLMSCVEVLGGSEIRDMFAQSESQQVSTEKNGVKVRVEKPADVHKFLKMVQKNAKDIVDGLESVKIITVQYTQVFVKDENSTGDFRRRSIIQWVDLGRVEVSKTLPMDSPLNILSKLVKDISSKGYSTMFKASTLTSLLQPSLGRNANVIMMGTISGNPVNEKATLSTLEYLQEFRSSSVLSVSSHESMTSYVRSLRQDNIRMRDELEQLKLMALNSEIDSTSIQTGGMPSVSGTATVTESGTAEATSNNRPVLSSELELVQNELRFLNQQMRESQSEMDSLLKLKKRYKNLKLTDLRNRERIQEMEEHLESLNSTLGEYLKLLELKDQSIRTLQYHLEKRNSAGTQCRCCIQ